MKKILEQLERGEISAEQAEEQMMQLAKEKFEFIRDCLEDAAHNYEGSLTGFANKISEMHINQFIK